MLVNGGPLRTKTLLKQCLLNNRIVSHRTIGAESRHNPVRGHVLQNADHELGVRAGYEREGRGGGGAGLHGGLGASTVSSANHVNHLETFINGGLVSTKTCLKGASTLHRVIDHKGIEDFHPRAMARIWS